MATDAGGYYERFFTVEGITIKANSYVQHVSLHNAAGVIGGMMRSFRGDIRLCMSEAVPDIAIAPKGESLITLPEFLHLRGVISPTTGQRHDHSAGIASVGGTRRTLGIIESELLRGNYETIVHEIAHAVQHLCFSQDEHDEWNRFYRATKRAGLFPGAYGMTNSREFFAVFSESYFDRPCARQRRWDKVDRELTGHKLRADFPEIFGFLERVYESWEVGSYFTAGTPDRDILGKLYEATTGPKWTNSENWLSETPIEEWHGVTVGDHGRVTRLQLSDNGLSGEIPRELGNLAELDVLLLHENQLTGEIPPELGNLANLTVLSLSENQLSGQIPSELGNLANLTELIITRNRLTGEIPPELGNLANLEHLNLSGNQLSGQVPSELGNLTNLRGLSLSGNQLSGQIPSELGSLASLRELILTRNQLTGEIPSELDNLAELGYLYLGGNQLTGEIPPELGNLANLRWLYMWENQLSGQIPSELGNLANLERLRLSGNQLSGCIPGALHGVPETDLDALNLPSC